MLDCSPSKVARAGGFGILVRWPWLFDDWRNLVLHLLAETVRVRDSRAMGGRAESECHGCTQASKVSATAGFSVAYPRIALREPADR